LLSEIKQEQQKPVRPCFPPRVPKKHRRRQESGRDPAYIKKACFSRKTASPRRMHVLDAREDRTDFSHRMLALPEAGLGTPE